MENTSQTQTEESSPLQKTFHPYGTIWEASDCNVLQEHKKGSLLIAPFHDKNFNNKIIIWDPKTLKVIKTLNSENFWRVWDQYYATFGTDDSGYVNSITVYTIGTRGLKKLKYVEIGLEYDFRKIQRMVGSKNLKSVYMMEDLWVGAISLKNGDQNEFASEETILQAIIHEEHKLFIICSYNQILIHKLEESGKIEDDPCYTIDLEFEFGVAYLKENELVIVSNQELKEEGVTKLHLSRFLINEDSYEQVEHKYLIDLPAEKYDFEFLAEGRAVVCMADEQPVSIVAIETGKVLFKSEINGKLLKIDPKSKSMFVSSFTYLEKLNIDLPEI